MKILITGGLGNLGSWLTEYFINKGEQVFTFSKNERNVLKDLNFKRLYGDISEQADLVNFVGENRFDIVIHLASLNEGQLPGYPKKALEVNSWGTRNLLQAVADTKENTHFIYFSTFHVYGVAHGIIDESTILPDPRNDYGSTHLFAEYYTKQFHQTHKVPFTIFRLTNSYGCPKEMNSSKWYLILNDLAKMAVEKKVIQLNSNGLPQRDFIWMGDVCNVVDKCISKGPANDIFNLGSGSSIQMIEVAKIIQEAYKDYFSEDIKIVINENDKNCFQDPLHVSTDKLKKWVEFSPANKMYDEAIKIFRLLN